MSANAIDKNKVLDIGVDAIIFMGTKYVLHHGVDMPHVHNLNAGDIGIFVAADGVYHMWIGNYFDAQPFDSSAYNCEINKFGGIMAGASLLNLITGRKERILDNLISIGISGIVTAIIDNMRGKSRCT